MTRSRWFVTAEFTARRPTLPLTVVAVSVAHAKEMGTRLTACGLLTDSWTKIWEQPFPPGEGDVCPRCMPVLYRMMPGGQSTVGSADRRSIQGSATSGDS